MDRSLSIILLHVTLAYPVLFSFTTSIMHKERKEICLLLPTPPLPLFPLPLFLTLSIHLTKYELNASACYLSTTCITVLVEVLQRKIKQTVATQN